MNKQHFTELTTGWMAPDGDFYQTGVMEHLFLAHELVETYYPDSPYVPYEDDILLKHGWCKVTIMNFLEHGYYFVWNRHLTAEQKAVIKPIYEANRGRIVHSNCCDLDDELY